MSRSGIHSMQTGTFCYSSNTKNRRRCPSSIPEGGEAGRAVAGRLPVVGRHGEKRFELGSGHRDGAGDFPLSNGAEALIGHLLHRIFYRAYRRGSPSSGTDAPRRAPHRSSACRGAGRGGTPPAQGEKQSPAAGRPSQCGTGWAKLDATAYRAAGRALAAQRTAGFAMSNPRASASGCSALRTARRCTGHTSPRRSPHPAGAAAHPARRAGRIRGKACPAPDQRCRAPPVEEGAAGGDLISLLSPGALRILCTGSRCQ